MSKATDEFLSQIKVVTRVYNNRVSSYLTAIAHDLMEDNGEIPMGFIKAFEDLESDADFNLYECEIGLFSQDDSNTAYDIKNVLVACESANDANDIALDICKENLEILSGDSFNACCDANEIYPPKYIDLDASHLDEIMSMADCGEYELEASSGADYDCMSVRVDANRPLFWKAENIDDDSILGNLFVSVNKITREVDVSITIGDSSACDDTQTLETWLKKTLFV
jgi:hypothetical protein